MHRPMTPSNGEKSKVVLVLDVSWDNTDELHPAWLHDGLVQGEPNIMACRSWPWCCPVLDNSSSTVNLSMGTLRGGSLLVV